MTPSTERTRIAAVAHVDAKDVGEEMARALAHLAPVPDLLNEVDEHLARARAAEQAAHSR
jgi:hypothetical protein